MKYDISVLIPSIRSSLLEGVYNSLKESCHEKWELIVIGPYDLPDALKEYTNINYIYDMGSPIRSRQRGLIAAQGRYICYAADDVLFYPNSLDIAYKKLLFRPYNDLVVGKYMEGKEDNPEMQSDNYWNLYHHDFLKPLLSDTQRNYKLINTGLISTALMMEIGGFDCSFEACAMACCDLSIRLQNYGANIILQQEPIFHSTHLPAHEGDHKPIHTAQVGHDMPLFQMMYCTDEGKKRTKIDINNWENTSDYWTRRFGEKKRGT